MPSDKNNERLDSAEESFRKLLLEQFELEPEFVSTICGFFRTATEPLAEASAPVKRSRASTNKSKTRRKKSAYNVYVREMMKTEDIQKLDHKKKMGEIAKKWKGLPETDRVQYTDTANSENAENSSVEETE